MSYATRRAMKSILDENKEQLSVTKKEMELAKQAGRDAELDRLAALHDLLERNVRLLSKSGQFKPATGL
jgi:hypothetical protein